MKTKMIKGTALAALLGSFFAVNTAVSGIYYLPDVNEKMSLGSYWTEDTQVFMSYEEIFIFWGELNV